MNSCKHSAGPLCPSESSASEPLWVWGTLTRAGRSGARASIGLTRRETPLVPVSRVKSALSLKIVHRVENEQGRERTYKKLVIFELIMSYHMLQWSNSIRSQSSKCLKNSVVSCLLQGNWSCKEDREGAYARMITLVDGRRCFCYCDNWLQWQFFQSLLK